MQNLFRIFTVIMILSSLMGVASIAEAGGYKARATGYYPFNNDMEGGVYDRLGKKLYTLQAYLNGKAPYVSLAMDSRAFSYGTKIQIPELDKYYGKQIEFRVVDTGNAFRGKGKSRVDICVSGRDASLHDSINRTLTLVPLH